MIREKHFLPHFNLSVSRFIWDILIVIREKIKLCAMAFTNCVTIVKIKEEKEEEISREYTDPVEKEN